MTTIILNDLDSVIVKKLAIQAQQNGRTIEEELKNILAMVVNSSNYADNNIEEYQLSCAKESFREGWQQALNDETYPIDELWQGIDNE